MIDTYERKVCVIMYIRKSVISRTVMFLGACVLLILAFLYCFTEIEIPGAVYMLVWSGCILTVVEMVGKIER